MNYLDLFSGIGGFRQALKQAEIPIEHEFHSEIDKHAGAVYAYRFPSSVALGDITKIKTQNGTINGKRIDLITFGFPCVDVSVAGKQLGFKGTRSSLFFEAIRLIQELRPEFFIFENVKGLFSNDNGRTFAKVLETIAEIGYDGQWELCNSKWFVPQNRERVFFIGHIRNRNRPEVFPLREAKTIHNATEGNEIQQDSINTLRARDYASWRVNFIRRVNEMNRPQGERVYDVKGIAPTLAAQAGGLGAKTGLYACPVLTPNRPEKRQNGRRIKEPGEEMFTLTAQDQHGVLVYDDYNSNIRSEAELGTLTTNIGNESVRNGQKLIHLDSFDIRRLTPVECERCQGFPDNHTQYGIYDDIKILSISDTQRYKMCGNAITVDVAEEIFRRLYEKD